MTDHHRDALRQVHPGAVVAVWDAQASDEELEGLAEIFQVLASPTRLRIVEALAEVPELCVSDLSTVVGVSESAVSHQLRVLRQLRMVRHRRDGRMVYYRLEDDHVADLFQLGLDHVRE